MPYTSRSECGNLSALILGGILFISTSALQSAELHDPQAKTPVELCLQQQVLDAANSDNTITQLRQRCEQIVSDAAAKSNTGTNNDSSENDSSENSVSITNPERRSFFRPYKDNYLVLGRMRLDDGGTPFSGEELDIKFELGLTFSLFEGRENLDFLAPLHVGYSQKSWWNITEESAPFREHNYNPEIYWQFDQPRRPLIGRAPFVDKVGVEHQSNGQEGLLSRSWDRVYAQKEFHLLPMLSVEVKVWDILGREANNDDIRHYLGNGQISVMFRPNDRTNLRWRFMRGSEVETLSYTFDIYYRRPNVNGAFFIQYQDGYGEALASYNQKSQTLRGGFYFPLDIFD